MEPIIISVQDAGKERGTRIYFSYRDLKRIKEKFGENFFLFNNRRLLARVDPLNNTIIITSLKYLKSLSNKTIQYDGIDFIESIEDDLDLEIKIDRIIDLEKEEMESFRDELLTIISENKVEISNREIYSVLQFAKGHHTSYDIQNAIRIGLRANRDATQTLINDYIEEKEE